MGCKMGYKDFQNLDGANGENQTQTTRIDAQEGTIQLPDSSYVRDADLSRDGMDLVLEGPHGSIVIDGYFAQLHAPTLVAPDGSNLTPDLVQSFAKSSPVYAQATSANDESPIGAVHEVSGSATVTHPDGSSEPIQKGTAIYQGDIIETSGGGAVNIMFIDESTFSVSEDARLAIDEFVFDPSSAEGVNNFSVLKGVFVYTSGIIGREDPDDVHIKTPVGSIGIRGTIIAGDVNSGEITVVEGAIVLRDPFGNEMTLANQFETAKFDTTGGRINNLGQISANDVSGKFSALSSVSGSLFSSIQDAAQQVQTPAATSANPTNGSVDTNGDGSVDGTVDGNTQQQQETAPEGEKRGDAAPAGEGETTVAGAPENQESDQEGQKSTALADSNLEETTLSDDASGLDAENDDNTDINTAQSTSHGTSDTGRGSSVTAEAKASAQAHGKASATLASISSGAEVSPWVLRNFLSRFEKTNAETKVDPTPPAFEVTSTVHSVEEGQLGAIVATLTGNHALTSVSISSFYQNFFEIVRVNDYTFNVKLRDEWDMDYETIPQLSFEYTAHGAGALEQSGEFVVDVTNVIEAPTYIDGQISEYEFIGVSGQEWSLSFFSHFEYETHNEPNITLEIWDQTRTIMYAHIAPGGDLIIDEPLPSFIDDVFFYQNGRVFINFADDLSTNQYFHLIAYDADGIFLDQDFTVYHTGVYFTDAGTLSSNATLTAESVITSLSVASTNSTLIFGDDDDAGIVVTGDENTIILGDGHDNITIADGQGNVIFGGDGNDTFFIYTTGNFIYGGDDRDEFILNTNTSALFDEFIADTTGSLIDGGAFGDLDFINFGETATTPGGNPGRTFHGTGDILRIEGTNAETLDFRGVQNIKNIEILNVNDSHANHIILGHNDVLSMTGSHQTLIIYGNGLDSVEYESQGMNDYIYGGLIEGGGGMSFHSYFDGDVTLLIETQITNVMIDGVAAQIV